MTKLAGKTCIVTGGASGIGLAIAHKLAGEGAKVVIADLNGAKAQDAVGAISSPIAASAVKLDVRDPAAFLQAVQAIADEHGAVDVLFNNAGVGGQAGLDDIDRERFEAMMSINVFSVVAGTQAAAAVMRKQGYGKIINTCSISGRRVFPGHTLYGATKFAVRALTLGFSQELAKDGIRVNAICPGMVHTALWDGFNEGGLTGGALVDAYAQGVALGRAAQPEDIAGAALFFASPDSDYITGQFITVDGGLVFD
ncbi:SDR family NAD(P)-dependent oxidoreductase [Novosphingobium aquimarinum]|uniref:SDR family NAD(P)-dependent oxidoreductase n=1 Tax=Novosphingobium aquimarinum TaxID=2682494 RepID=UPI0018DC43FA|nr:SDR family oxidoreductase [Novosphingobium aquimarinum]